MDDEPVSAHFEDCRTYFSNPPARLAQSSAATTEITGVSTVNDTLIPLATVADVERSIALSDARHEREVSPMVRSRGAGSVAISAATSVQPAFGHVVTLGRRGSSGRRMPGMVRKSLQEQELRELLEASKQAIIGNREQTGEARAHTHRRGVGISDSMVHASVAGSVEPRASIGSGLSTRACYGLTSRVVLDNSGGGEDGCAALREICVEHSAPSGRSQTNSNALKRPCPEGGGRDGAREEQSLSRYAQAGAAAMAMGTTASSTKSAPTVTSTGSPDPETHPILELYRSSREPLDQLTFFELKRRIESAVLEDGAGPASMAKLIDYLRNSKRFGEDQIARLEALYGRRARSEDGDAQVFVNDEEAVDGSGVEESLLENDGETYDDLGDGKERGRGSPVADKLQHCPCHNSTAGSPPASAAPPVPGSLSQVILKFTTVADGSEAPSFAVGREGATVGRGPSNDISIPTDPWMGDSNHASIVWKEGAFHVQDRGHPYGASIRIGTGKGLREWPLDPGSVFSAGNSVFLTKEIDEMGMLLEIVAGPLKGERRRVQREGATVGRATENTISIADRELSRHHSTLECDISRHHSKDETRILGPRNLGVGLGRGGPDSGGGDRARADGLGRVEFYLCDVGSTNGTYVQLVGPYAGSRRLELSDHILIGRTGFSINRFDWGVWEDRGARRAMEDKSVVIQDMGVESLAALGLGPQTFLGVYDGHGGAEASAFLWQRLHVNVAEALEEAAPRVAAALEEDCEAERREAEQKKLLASTSGAPADEEDIVEPAETGPASGDADIVAPDVGASHGGPGADAGRVETDGCGEDEDKDEGDFVVKKLDFVDVRCSSPTGVVSSGDTGRTSSPTCDAASPPALADGVGNGGGQACGSEKAAGTRGHTAVGRSGKEDGSVETGGSGWRETCEVRCIARGQQSSASVECEGIDCEWRWGSRHVQDSAGGTSCIARDPSGGGTREFPSASGLPESLCEATATAGVDSRTGDAGILHAPMEGREGGGVNGELAAGGEAASGVQTERDGAGGAQGGGALEQTDGSRGPEAPVSGCSRTSDSVRGDGFVRGNGGRDSPTPVTRGRSGVQSPGGEPSRSLATAGLPAEGEGGAGACKQQGSGSKSPGRRGHPMTAVDRVMEEVVCQAFLDTDEDFLTSASMPSCGSTATTVMILGNRLYSFNVGDSRTLVCRRGRVMLETRDHKPDREDEMERIKKAGGIVIHKRVMGELAVSRAFGDKAFKMGIKAILREEHEVQELELEGEDEFGLDFDYEDDMDGMLEEEGNGDFGGYDEMNKEMEQPATGMQEYGPMVDGEGGAASGLNISVFSSSCGPGIPKLLPPAETAPLPPPPPPPLEDAPVAVPKEVETHIPRARVTDPTDALIIALPEMSSCRLTPEDEFVLLACDGLFDVFSSEEVVDIVREEMRKHGDTQRVCETLTRKAIDERYTRDNVSVVLVVLKKFW